MEGAAASLKARASTEAGGSASGAAGASTEPGGAAQLTEGAAGMDPATSFLLKIHLLGNRKKARKDVKCFSFDMVVDSDLSNYKDFIESVTEKYPPGYLEVAHVQYYDNVLKIFPEVKSDQDLMSMFDIHNKEKVVEMFVGYCDPSETFEPITEWEFVVEGQPENNIDQDEDGYLRNPLPENEHVGVDEETMYLDIAPVNALVVPGCSERGKEKANPAVSDLEDDSDDEFEDDDELESDEEEAYEEVNHHPIIDFDEEDPPMEVGSTDAGQAIMAAVAEVFPQAEHRECMFHLVTNFKKKYHGQVFDDHLWAAAYAWNPYMFEKHWVEMEKAKPAATNYIRLCHNKLWTRSQFSTISKVDYVTNNLAESFNNWIKQYKSMNLDDLMDKIRQLLMIKWNQRRKIGKKLDGLILPHIIKKLNEKSRELNLEVSECSEEVAEITLLGGTGFRFVVNLAQRTCTCRQWQVSGIPCKHALAFITALPNAPIEKYVDLYYSIEKFRVAYSALIPAMPDKTQWPKCTHGFFMHGPLLKSVAGRHKTEGHKGGGEKKGKKGQHQCPICKEYGHHWHNCRKGSKRRLSL